MDDSLRKDYYDFVGSLYEAGEEAFTQHSEKIIDLVEQPDGTFSMPVAID